MRGRSRTIKPELFSDEKLWDLEAETGMPLLRVFIGLWCYCDREGRFRWAPRALRGAIAPCWEGDFEAALEALASKLYIVRYTVSGKDYGYVRTFKEHQPIHPREPRSELPGPSEHACKPFPGKSGTPPGESAGFLEPLEAHVEAEVEVEVAQTRARSDATALHRERKERHEPSRPARVYTMPCEEPPSEYLDEALMAGVGRAQAAATWTHYWTAGLPERGVEKLYPWLVKSAKERSNATTKVGSRAPSEADERLERQAERIRVLKEQEAAEERAAGGGS